MIRFPQTSHRRKASPNPRKNKPAVRPSLSPPRTAPRLSFFSFPIRPHHPLPSHSLTFTLADPRRPLLEGTMAEQTFIMIKPDGVQRGLIGDIISRFEKKGFYLKGMKFMNVEKSFAQQHYADLSDKPFFPGLVEYIISGPVVAMVWEGKDVVATGRRIIGATRPWEASPGTIRGDYAVEVGRNVIHGSDSVENGKKEIALWFPEGVAEWKSNLHPWIYES